jgi:hypothetical protein
LIDRHAGILAGIPFAVQRQEFIMQLQQTYGNRYVQRVMESIKAQAKLSVSDPGDVYEQEADRMADIVTRDIRKPLSRQEEEEEETPGAANVQMQFKQNEPAVVSDELEKRINLAHSGGQLLSEDLRLPMEQAFGADFKGVRIHTDAEADALNQDLSARAFTVGKDIFFRQNEYNPGAGEGQKLIAHELTHVVQQSGGLQNRKKAGKPFRPAAAARVNFASKKLQPLWGSSRPNTALNPFASRKIAQAALFRVTGAASQIQRHKVTIGEVEFESSNFTAALAGGLYSNNEDPYLRVASQDYTASGKVTSKGPAKNTENWEAGFLQTLYNSEVKAYYKSRVGLIGRVLSFAGLGSGPKQGVSKMYIPQAEIRDSLETSTSPWYNHLENKTFATNAAGVTPTQYDKPQAPFLWKTTFASDTQRKDHYLYKIAGSDTFRAWLVVQQTSTGVRKCLEYQDWKVDYGAGINYDTKAVTDVGGGGKLIGKGVGDGGKAPNTGADIANPNIKLVDTWPA